VCELIEEFVEEPVARVLRHFRRPR
jgi:hypothetical protein